MYRKDLFKDWSSFHIVDYGWYLDCPKDNTLALEFSLSEKKTHDSKKCSSLLEALRCKRGRIRGLLWEIESRLMTLNPVSGRNPVRRFT
jgi:hypothetical protein